MEQGLRDNGGRRSGMDRRQFSYTGHIPERRVGEDRRSRLDRRCGEDRRNGIDQAVEMNQRSGLDRRAAFQM
jgi:hypothetical protein